MLRTKLCKDTGIDFEPVRDFYGPIDKKRISTILSKLVAFLLFRNAKLKTYEERYGDYLNQFVPLTIHIPLFVFVLILILHVFFPLMVI